PRPLPRGRRADGAPARPPGLTRAPRLVHSPTTGGAATPPPTLGDALAPPASTSSYLGAELVACTVRARHAGTSSEGNGNRERDGDPTGTPAGRPDLAPTGAGPGPACPAPGHRAPASTNSYCGAQLVACTVRARHPGTS